MNRSSQVSGNFGWVSFLTFALVVAIVWALAPTAQASTATLAATTPYDQGGALLVGVLGMLYIVRRRRRIRA